MSPSDIDPETDEFVDVGEPIRVGATPHKKIFEARDWSCDWCGARVTVEVGETFDCSECPNEGQ